MQRYLEAAGHAAGLQGRCSARSAAAATPATLPLGPDSIRAIVRRRAAAVDGIAGRIGGHSLRVGSAHELAADGASVAELQQAGGWKSPTTPGVYIRREAAARGPVARPRYKGGRVTPARRTAIGEQLGISPVVLAGLTDAQLRHVAREPLTRSGYLPGESEAGGYSVYRITFEDGAAYVGISHGFVIERMEQHFGGGPRDLAPALQTRMLAPVLHGVRRRTQFPRCRHLRRPSVIVAPVAGGRGRGPLRGACVSSFTQQELNRYLPEPHMYASCRPPAGTSSRPRSRRSGRSLGPESGSSHSQPAHRP